jgi:hypothetical protein
MRNVNDIQKYEAQSLESSEFGLPLQEAQQQGHVQPPVSSTYGPKQQGGQHFSGASALSFLYGQQHCLFWDLQNKNHVI